MGRPGRSSSSSGSRRSSSSSRRTSSRSHSSSSSRSSSSRSSSSRSYSSSHNSYNYGTNHNNSHYNGHHSHYYGSHGTGLLSGLLSRVLSTVVFLIIFVVLIFGKSNKISSTNIDEKTVEQYANTQYSKLFNDESHLLLVYAYLDRNETDTATLSFGYDSSELISSELENYFWNRYEINYSSDLNESEWLGNTFKETAENYNDTEKLNSFDKFDKNCYKDNLGWIKSNEKEALINGCESFYNKTGIQPYILLINYEDIPGVVVKGSSNSNFGFVAIIAIVGLIIVIVIKRIVKMKIDQKNKEQEDLEKILNTPLEKYSDDLVDKYQ